MSLDGLFVYALTRELAETCIGGRITKIHQPNPHDIVLAIRANGQNHKLMISAHPAYPRMHFTEHSFQNPLEPPMFCMLLRKHCEGGFIESIQQVGLERILHIDVRSRDELGDEATRRIIVEIMGRHSNIILTDPASNQILDSIHHVTPAVSRHRIVLPGRSYQEPPEQGKLNPMSVTHDKFISLLDLNQGKIEKQLVQLFTGISPLSAQEIVHRAGLPKRENLWNAFSQVITLIEQNEIQPQLVKGDSKSHFYVLPLESIHGNRTSFESISACLDAFFHVKAEADVVKQRASDLSRFLVNEYEKNEKKIEKLKDTLQEAAEADKFRIYGELLTANLYQMKRGDTEVRVVNFYDENQSELTITLDPQLSPSENAQRYFKKYNKAKKSIAVVQEQIQHAQEEMVYLETILQQVETASVGDIEDIREELVEGGYLRNRNRKDRRKKKNHKPALSVYYSSEGFPIYVGKNNKQNDYLSQRLASPQDTWLHTKDTPGSHVVIRGRDFSEATLKEAAALAAYFSKARSSSQVPVDYTLIKHVKKPNGAKPGYVIYDNQKTLFITPEESVIKDIQNNIDKPKKN
jgi:predicted ribosome quality control (RQC) complex YloA/Tae2 family protein